MKTKFSGILTLLLAFVVQLTFAQEKTISGTISDESGLPLPGVNIIVSGTSNGTQTDFDGNYSISANTGDVLEYSFVGYKTVNRTVGAANNISFGMEVDSEALEEVIIVAYGSQKKEAIVGSIGVVSSEDIEVQQATSPLRALQGSVAGVNLLTSGGQPGNNPDIRIRGFSSINASQSPLIILDGAPFIGNINTISQDQIESISVLKDASSTSLYGSRGANGVIIITTKKGRLNTEPTVRIRSQYGISNPTEGLHDLVNAEDYLKLTWQALKNTNQYENGQTASTAAINASNQLTGYLGYNPTNVNTPIDSNGNLAAGASILWDTDWESLVLNNNVQRINHNLGISGGGERSTYSFSLDYLNEEGPVITSDFERISTRLNLSSQVKDWLKIGVNTGFSRSSSSVPDQTSGSTTQTISWIYNLSSIYPVYVRDQNGQLINDNQGGLIYDLGNGNGRDLGQPVNNTRPLLGGEHILASIYLGDEEIIRTNYLANVFAEVDVFKNLKFRSSFNYENYLFDSYSFDDDEIGAASNVDGRVSRNRNITTAVNAVQKLTYDNNFGNHNLIAEALMESYTETSDDVLGQGTGLLPGQAELGNTSLAESVGGIKISRRINGYLGRLAYNYDNKYFFEASGRRDGASQFSEETRWASFYSLGASWIATKEEFLQNDVLTYLKLRASYGELGNIEGIGFFPYQSAFQNDFLNDGSPGILPPDAPDPLITWETTGQTNFGIDFQFLNNKIFGSIDRYKKESIDLIYNVPREGSSGVNGLLTNNGTIENSGLEVVLGANIFNKEDFSWKSTLNVSFDKNEITELPVDRFISGTKLWEEGNSLFDFFIQEWAGVNPANGRGMWYTDIEDADGNVVGRTVTENYEDATRYETDKSSIPDFYGGLNNIIRYKQFDLNFLINYSFGAYLLDREFSGLINPFESPGSSAHPSNFNAWQQPGDIADTPLLLASNNDHSATSTRFLYKNDYVRLKSVNLGYNLPVNTIKKLGLSTLRFFAQADNILTWQTHKGIDPEQAFNGITGNRSPLQKTISMGAIIEF